MAAGVHLTNKRDDETFATEHANEEDADIKQSSTGCSFTEKRRRLGRQPS